MISIRNLVQKPSFVYTTTRFLTSQSPDFDTPTSASYDNLITAAGRSRDFTAIHNLLNKRYIDGCFSTTKTFNFITSTETETDLTNLLNELSQTLARVKGYLPRKNSFDSLISRLCNLNRIDESLRIIRWMIRDNFGANVQSFYPILNALTRKRRFDEAWKVMELMRESKISPDRTAYNYLLTSYCVVGDLTSATGVLTKLEKENVPADSRTYDALVIGACKVGKVEAAMVVLRRMVDDGVPVLYCTHVHVISALLRLGYYAQAVEFVTGLKGRDKGLDTESFGILASRLIKLKRFDEAKLVLTEMRNLGLVMGEKLDGFYRVNVSNDD